MRSHNISSKIVDVTQAIFARANCSKTATFGTAPPMPALGRPPSLNQLPPVGAYQAAGGVSDWQAWPEPA